MKKKTIIILFKHKITETEFANYNFLFLKNFFYVKFVDISYICFKKKFQNLIKDHKKLPNLIKVKNFKDLNKTLLNVDYIFDLNDSFNLDKKLVKNLDKRIFKKIKSIFFLNSQLPSFFNLNKFNKIKFCLTFLFYIVKYKKFLYFLKIINKFFKIIFNYKKNLKKKYNFFYTYTLIDSWITEQIANNYFFKSKKIFVHNKDFERHLFSKFNKKSNRNYAVFLDQAMFDHPDSYLFNDIQHLTKKEERDFYYKILNNFFDKFEKKTKLKIIIAAHPKRIKRKKIYIEKIFGTRKVVFNKTYNLVKNSKLVFAHNSTSVNYAIILKKPIVFINSELMFKLGLFNQILYYAIETGSRHLCIDRNFENYNFFIKKDLKNYKDYLNKYIKSSKSSNISFWKKLSTQINSKQI